MAENLPFSRATGVLATAIIQLEQSGKVLSNIRCLIDSGAQISLISMACVEAFELKTTYGQALVSGIGGVQETHGIVRAMMHARSSIQWGISEEFVIVSRIMDEVPSRRMDYFTTDHILSSDLADENYNIPAKVDVVLGAGVCARIFREKIMNLQDGLIALDTKLGWIIFGEHTGTRKAKCQLMQEKDADADLDVALRRLWEADLVDEADREMKPDEMWCEQNFEKTCHRDADGRYVTTISVKPEALNLGESYSNALRRFRSLERRFQRDTELASRYKEFMREYEELGHMRLAHRPVSSNHQHYYIPHHPVLKKFRVVFDASARTSNGKSLNDIQLSGPKLQSDLFDIILRFRARQIALSADVKKMFRQVRIRQDQWDLQRILWRGNPTEEIKEYWLTVITYGLTSAGYNAVKAMLKCVVDHHDEFPLAQKIVRQCFYMDDMLVSVDTVKEAKEVYQQVRGSLQSGGFELAKWASNNSQAISDEPGQTMVSVEENQDVSVLGLVWEPASDDLRFKVAIDEISNQLTKRQVASQGARLFDPNGYLTPITIRAKIFMQNLWRTGVQWDETLAPHLIETWKKYYEGLQEIADIRIPRWIGMETEAKLQIHAFCDASSKAYGAVLYMRTEHKDKGIKINLLTSKSKVADLQTVSIPRLELCAARLAAELAQHVNKTMALANVEIYYWTDSEIVLHWLRKFPSELKVYVGNRVSAIQACSKVRRWRHIDSKRNPADLISRGSSVKVLKTSELWWKGPGFLKERETNWPMWKKGDPAPEDLEAIAVESKKIPDYAILLITGGMIRGSTINLLERFERLSKAIRVTAYVMRFVRKCKPELARRLDSDSVYQEDTTRQKGHHTVCQDMEAIDRHVRVKVMLSKVHPVTTEEYNEALIYWIVFTQRVHFSDELNCLKRNETVRKSSRLYNFVPFVQETTGIIRMRGRIDRSSLTYDQRHPIILPNSSTLALKLMAEAHRVTLHGGNQICMQYLRDRYWIIGLRSAMRNFIRRCVICAARAREMASQLMADLPEARVRISRPFTHCGVDFAGPLRLKPYKNARGTKIQLVAYVSVFVCFATKAVHLELVGDLTTKAFLGALDRMILRRNNVEHLYSDRGRNFIGAASELKRIHETWQSSEIIDELTVKGITWHFNTPLAPHHGGLWEAAVKSFKFHLARVAGEMLFTFEELNTLLVRIEACLNSRPLVAISDNPLDLTVITPGHLLTGHQIIKPLSNDPGGSSDTRIAWDRIRVVEEDLWQRWSREYLMELQRRSKWATAHANIKEGDLVIIKEESMVPGHWKRGRVVEVYTGKDGLVRSVLVRTASSEYERPITRLCILPVDTDMARCVQPVGLE